MAHQDLNGAEISTRLEQMSSEAMPKHVGMGTNLDSGSLGGLLACIPNRFRNDRPIRAVAAVAPKEPDPRSLSYAVPMLPERLEQLKAKPHVPSFSPLSAIHMSSHV